MPMHLNIHVFQVMITRDLLCRIDQRRFLGTTSGAPQNYEMSLPLDFGFDSTLIANQLP
jgi:hypothetical protein